MRVTLDRVNPTGGGQVIHMTEATGNLALRQDEMVIAEKKRVALSYLIEAWDEAIAEGVDSEILAHAALFAALSDLVTTYGEDAVAGLAERLPDRIRASEFTLERVVQ
jgi:hypothetical protein